MCNHTAANPLLRPHRAARCALEGAEGGARHGQIRADLHPACALAVLAVGDRCPGARHRPRLRYRAQQVLHRGGGHADQHILLAGRHDFCDAHHGIYAGLRGVRAAAYIRQGDPVPGKVGAVGLVVQVAPVASQKPARLRERWGVGGEQSSRARVDLSSRQEHWVFLRSLGQLGEAGQHRVSAAPIFTCSRCLTKRWCCSGNKLQISTPWFLSLFYAVLLRFGPSWQVPMLQSLSTAA